MPVSHTEATRLAAFFQRVEVQDGDDPCWLWTGHITEDGYGCTPFADGSRLAHVWSWVQANGPVPEGVELDHRCRVRRCVAAFHLEPVPHKTNVRRGALAKLTEKQVDEIRLYLSLGISQGELARTYGVNQPAISKIATGRTWGK